MSGKQQKVFALTKPASGYREIEIIVISPNGSPATVLLNDKEAKTLRKEIMNALVVSRWGRAKLRTAKKEGGKQ